MRKYHLSPLVWATTVHPSELTAVSHPALPLSGCYCVSRRHRLTIATVLSNIRGMADETSDITSKLVYAQRRQEDAVAWAIKEKELLAAKAKRQLEEEALQQREERKLEAYTTELEQTSGPEVAAAARQRIREESDTSVPYTRSVDAFGDKSVKLQHSFSGLADNRIIMWWELLYWNYIRFFFTQERLIAKDRFGNKFTVTWQFQKGREEQRRMYRKDSNKKHLPYGTLATDDRLWERWMRGHRGDPPSVAEEEHSRSYKKSYFGPMILDDEEVEDALMRIMAHMNRSQQTFQELDDDQVYGDAHRATKPLRQTEHNPQTEYTQKAKSGATWTLGFVRGDLFYNEEEVEVMRTELGHVFRNMAWQELEYKRQVRMNKKQHPVRKPTSDDPNDPDGEPFAHYWERTDLGIPYHDAVPDLTTPELERLRIEADQLEDERLAIRKELGLTDLGDIREGRNPIDKDGAREPFQPPPVSTRWRPKCWEEAWGTGAGNKW
ncbi:hypothetical protein, conserved [Trypanosoma brucei brucei TREU927]|uniref:Uncharacterized protein n=2 Tax=Trypanosoma brucei TaxID=5691 RepID=Q57VV7_TRYB2|nr:hypothetical protein, conserved [Trypanosoma brucei brucei TREU927]AAX70257.1 hypothetical protein, conserved [Trypanosoma brucei]AAZ11171.1 hypothetical protein, conserved [Trypanosoma brucei brucei TREU927]